MSNRKLLTLGIVAAVMFALVAVQGRLSRSSGRVSLAGSYLIQGLEPAKIHSILIGKGENPVRLVRQGNGFVVGNKGDYPASIKKINDLLISCLDVVILDWITDDPANYESLDVSEEKAQNIVKFLDEKHEVITGVVIGSSRLPELQMENRTTYVRLLSGNDVHEAKDVPLVGGSATDYIEKEIVNISDEDVVRVTVTSPEGSYTLRVADGNDESIVLEDMPAGKKLKTSVGRQVISALSYLSLSDVDKESSLEAGKLEFDNTYVSELKDSTTYTFRIARADGKTYVKCSAEYMDKSRVIEEKKDLKQMEAKLLAPENAVRFTQSHSGWVYQIPEYKGDNLTKKMTDLVEDKEEEKPEEGAEAKEMVEESQESGQGEASGELTELQKEEATDTKEVGEQKGAEKGDELVSEDQGQAGPGQRTE
ncbi:MAG: DUF4340 domain-containing protein [Planctomycetota bacterium]